MNQMNDQSQTMNQLHMMNRSYGGWPASGSVPQPPLLPDDPMMFKSSHPMRQGFMAAAAKRSGWKGKKGKKGGVVASGSNNNVGGGGIGGGGGGYRPPTLNDLQFQNRMRARKFYGKKNNNRFAPYAPRNTTSFIIRAKKSGGIASLVSPCPVTPAVLPTPIFSPSREVLVDMAKEEWGVDGYGSMNGLIRLRSPGHDMNDVREEEEEEEEGGGSSESDVEEHVEVERRLDHDLSRFEMIYPNFADENGEHQMDEQDAHITQLEEENLTLKERLFLMERELIDLKMRMQCLETESRAKKKGSESRDGSLENEDGSNKDDNNEETTRHSNEKDDKHDNNDDIMRNESVGEREEEDNDNEEASENEGAGDICSEKSACDCD